MVLGLNQDKGPLVRMSKWSLVVLTVAQVKYTALDLILLLRIYGIFLTKPDLIKRLTNAEAVGGLQVGVVPSHDSLVTMATLAATGQVLAGGPVPPLPERLRRPRPGALMRHVRIDVAHAPSFMFRACGGAWSPPFWATSARHPPN